MNLDDIDPETIYKRIKQSPSKYDEVKHCIMILRVMLKQGRISAFCCEAMVCENTLYNWVKEHIPFAQCYALGKMYAREVWELEGERIRDMELPMGTISYAFEHWKMSGWGRFGVSKNPKIKLGLTPGAAPEKHYTELLLQAANGEFTASEFKQLMEAINVGLNVHQVFELQKEIDQLKSDLATMQANADGYNKGTNQGIAQKD